MASSDTIPINPHRILPITVDSHVNPHFMNMHQWQLLNIKGRCIITMCASCSAVYCNRSCLWVCVCLWVCYHDNSLEIACIDPHQTGFIGKGSDHLQLIKFWPSRAPGMGVCSGVKIFGSTLLLPARSVCISLTTFSFCHQFF